MKSAVEALEEYRKTLVQASPGEQQIPPPPPVQ
jgi:hypothetical protein